MSDQQNWERSVLEKLAMTAIQEQRRARHWSIFFKVLTFAYLFILLALFMGWTGKADKTLSSGKHTALVELSGVISSGSAANSERLIGSLQAAFKHKGTQAVLLRSNSPGGSPVQSGYVNDEIRRLRIKYPNIPIYAVVEDVCASGCYYIVAATDKIFVNKASLVGSIGVLMDGFGFTGAMGKLGVERRLITAGENKGFMDPFAPVNPVHQEHAKKMLEEIHQQFIHVVKQGRGKRLKEEAGVFSGLIWTGQKSIDLGLADEMGSVESVARDVVKAEDIVDFTEHENFSERLAKRLGAGVATALGLANGTDFSLR